MIVPSKLTLLWCERYSTMQWSGERTQPSKKTVENLEGDTAIFNQVLLVVSELNAPRELDKAGNPNLTPETVGEQPALPPV